MFGPKYRRFPVATYGYARVSTIGQSLDTQITALKAAGCERIYQEKASGKSKDGRSQLKRLLKELSDGDVIVVTRLDRLARSTLDLLRIVEAVRAAGASFKSLRETWADSASMHGRLFLTILGGLAEFERELTLERTAEGRAKAKANGTRLGRDFKLTGHQRRAVIHRLDAGDGHREIARDFNVSHQTIGRIARRHAVA
jgi:DNA invertase Pin-like site-specific DNA recombinase